MKKLSFVYNMDLEFDAEVINHNFSLKCMPINNSNQNIYSLDCEIKYYDYIIKESDCFGNFIYSGNINRAHKNFRFKVTGIAWIDASKINKESLDPIFKYESEYTKFDKAIENFYNDHHMLFEESSLQRAIFLMNLIYENIKYQSDVTNIKTTAGEALSLGKGVCQDYAHILISLCRKATIPARYVAGMMIGEGATHAWVEVYSDGAWYGIDPTHNKLVDDYYIKLAHGRDYKDCIINKGCFIGKVNQKQSVYVSVKEIN